MGRLEKQIIVGAIALVAVLLGVVVFNGVDAGEKSGQPKHKSEWGGEPLVLRNQGSSGSKDDSEAPTAAPARTISLEGDDEVLENDSSDTEVEAKRSELEAEAKRAAEEQQGSEAAGVALGLEDALRRYEVQPGETLGEIAMKQLGSMFDADLILEVNEGMTETSVLRAGQEIWLPQRKEADLRRESKSKEKAAATKESPGVRISTHKTHEVVSGDSLWRIAEQYYGREGASQGVHKIVSANRLLTDENTVLNIGWLLAIP